MLLHLDRQDYQVAVAGDRLVFLREATESKDFIDLCPSDV